MKKAEGKVGSAYVHTKVSSKRGEREGRAGEQKRGENQEEKRRRGR